LYICAFILSQQYAKPQASQGLRFCYLNDVKCRITSSFSSLLLQESFLSVIASQFYYYVVLLLRSFIRLRRVKKTFGSQGDYIIASKARHHNFPLYTLHFSLRRKALGSPPQL